MIWLACLVSAVAHALAVPNIISLYGWSLMGWLFAIPFFFALEGRSLFLRVLLGTLWGLATYAAHVFWLAPISFVGYVLFVLALSFQPLLFAGMYGYLRRSKDFVFLFLVPSAWVVTEWLRAMVLGGYNWNLASSQAMHPLLIQAASLGGAFCVSWFLIFINTGIFLAFKDRARRRVWIGIVLGSALVYCCLGHILLQAKNPAEPSVRVAAVQGNITRDIQTDDLYYDQNIAVSVALTRQIARKFESDLVIWPETVFTDDVLLNEKWRVRMEDLSRDLQTSILFGAVLNSGEGQTNSALLLSSRGEWRDAYHKRKLVPFGEYQLAGSVFKNISLMMGAGVHELIPGTSSGLMFLTRPERKIPFGVAICSEEGYSALFRSMAGQGAGFFITMLNDAWFDYPQALMIHATFSPLRAVETGRPVVRAANTGWTVAFDTKGQMVSGSAVGLQLPGVGTASIRPSYAPTVYLKYGHLFPFACGVFVIMTLLMQIRYRTQETCHA